MRLAAEPLAPAGDAPGGAPRLQLTAAPEGDAQQQAQQAQQQQAAAALSPYSRFPALAAPVGQPLSVTLSVTNHGRTAAAAASSGGASGGEPAAAPAAAGAAAAAAAGPLELQLEAAVACQPVRGSEQEEASINAAAGAAAGAPELSAVWAGQLWTGLRLSVPPGATVSQRLGLCLLVPGLYRIGLQHWHCAPAGAGGTAAAQQQQQQQQQHKKGGSRAPPPAPLNTMVGVQPCFVLATVQQPQR